MAAPVANRRARTAIFGVYGLAGFVVASVLARAPALQHQLGIGVGPFGFLVFTASFGAIFGLIVAPSVLRRAQARGTILLGVGGMGLGLVTFGIACEGRCYPLAVVGLVVYGLFGAIIDVSSNVEASLIEHDWGRPILPWCFASWSVGAIAGGFAGSLLAFARVPPLAGFVGLAAAVLVVAAWVVRWLPQDRGEHSEASTSPTRELFLALREPRVVAIAIVSLAMVFGEGAALDWLAIAFVDDRGFSPGHAALVLTAFSMAVAVGRFVSVPLLRRFSRVSLVRMACLLALAGLVTVITVPVIWIAFFGVGLWGLGVAVGFPVGISAAAFDRSRAVARVSAVTSMAYLAFLGPPVIGFVAQRIGVLSSLWIVVALVTGALIVARRGTLDGPLTLDARAE